MTINLSRYQTFILGIALAATFFGAVSAHADITIVIRTKDDNPQMKARMERMPDEQKLRLESVGINATCESTILISGKKTRIDDNLWSTFIYDKTKMKSVYFNSSTQTYFDFPYTETTPRRETNLADVKTTVIQAGDTKTILGHLCRHYHMTLERSSPRTWNVTADVYTAHALDPIDVFSTNRGPAWMLHEEFQKLDGMPVYMVLKQAAVNTGNVIDTVEVISISTTAIPPSAFDVPKQYRRLTPPPPPKPSTKLLDPVLFIAHRKGYYPT